MCVYIYFKLKLSSFYILIFNFGTLAFCMFCVTSVIMYGRSVQTNARHSKSTVKKNHNLYYLSLLPNSVTQTRHDNIGRQTKLYRILSNKLETLPKQYFGGVWIKDVVRYYLFWVAQWLELSVVPCLNSLIQPQRERPVCQPLLPCVWILLESKLQAAGFLLGGTL